MKNMILPIVKSNIEMGGVCSLPEKITYSYSCELGRLGAEALASFVSDVAEVDGSAFVEFIFDSSLEDKDEIYSVSVRSDGIKVGFRDARGAVNGAATVALLLRKREVRCCEIVDYPSCSYRSFLLDMARGLPTEDDIKEMVKYMALAKYNRLHLHLIDSRGPCYVSEALPEYKYTGNSEMCSLDFLREIDKLCESYAIDIVPELEIPAHSTAVCEAHPEFKCPVDGNVGWAICPDADGVWEFYDRLVAELCDVFPRSEYIHIGTDELEFGELGLHHHCFWDECPQCAELRAREGITDMLGEFYYVVDRMLEIVKAHGKKMMMWNDQIDISKDVPISREILIEFWRIAAPGRGPYEGCTFNGFLEKGFTVINAYYPSTYLDQNRYLSPEKMKTWTPFNVPEQSPEYAHQVIGGETCAWEFGNYTGYPFYGYVTPPVLALFGDKLWGLGEREHTDEFKEALAEYIFGSAEYTDVFECFGDLMPPRNVEIKTYHEEGKVPTDKIKTCIEVLRGNVSCPVSAKYIKRLEEVLADTEK